MTTKCFHAVPGKPICDSCDAGLKEIAAELRNRYFNTGGKMPVHDNKPTEQTAIITIAAVLIFNTLRVDKHQDEKQAMEIAIRQAKEIYNRSF